MRITILTGAGISAESGIPTFRDADGLWAGHRIDDVCTPIAWWKNPDKVNRFYDERRAHLDTVEPNAAHRALARLEQHPGIDLTVITQNVDDLHERAGTRNLNHIHGELRSALCSKCRTHTPWDGPLLNSPKNCGRCGRDTLRPDVVFFGERPYRMTEAETAVINSDLFVSIGTSGAVYPAAGFVTIASGGAMTLELNLQPSEGSDSFDESRFGKATELVPAWVDEIIAEASAMLPPHA